MYKGIFWVGWKGLLLVRGGRDIGLWVSNGEFVVLVRSESDLIFSDWNGLGEEKEEDEVERGLLEVILVLMEGICLKFDFCIDFVLRFIGFFGIEIV